MDLIEASPVPLQPVFDALADGLRAG